jgi:putative ABC transport system permease protein
MLKNYFKTAWRNLLKQKMHAFINIFGLSTGIAFFILLLLYVINELSFDRFHEKEKDIYCAYEWSKALDGKLQYSSSTAMPLGPALKQSMPDVIDYVRIKQTEKESFLKVNGEVYRVHISFSDPQFFSVFTFLLKYGVASSALGNLNSLVLTSSTARKLFGNDDIAGRTVQIKIEDNFQPFIISGVAEDIPANSSIKFDVMASFAFLQTTKFGATFNNWYTTSFRTYLLLQSQSHLPTDEERLAKFHLSHNPDDEAITKRTKSVITYGLLPLRSIHTNTKISNLSNIETIEPKTIWIILGIATSILVIACINFTTLTIGRSAGRSKEVGLRKVIGAKKRQIVMQFISEAFLLSILSTILGLLAAGLLLPYFNTLSGRELPFSFTQYPEISWLLIGLVLCVTLLSGSYPALLVSKFRPLEVLKNKIRLGGSNVFTQSLVTFQFALAIGLIISTLIILQQIRYMTSKWPGFEKENVAVIDALQTNTIQNYPLLKRELLRNADIIGVAASETGLGEGTDFQDHGFMFYGTHKTIYEYLVDTGYIHVLGIQLVAGRNFNSAITADTTTSVIINEAMMNEFGWKLNNVIGQQIKGYTTSKTPIVIGVVKNFNFQSLTEKIQPQLFHQFVGHRIQKIFVRIKPGNPSPALSAMEKTWKTIVPDVPFKYSFLNEHLDNYYKSEKRWSSIVGWAGGISIFLACLGLFGLTSLAAVNRAKEICVRKVLGASTSSIIALFSKDFAKLIVLALLVASPVAWYFMNNWLQSFAYRVQLGWQVFILAGTFAITVVLLTIGLQAIKAAIANPVKSLRTDG